MTPNSNENKNPESPVKDEVAVEKAADASAEKSSEPAVAEEAKK